MSYDPKPKKYPYTERTDGHYLVVKKNNGTVFDTSYPYIDKSKSFAFKKFLMRVALRTLAFTVMRIRLGLKIYGKEKIKRYKDVFDKGVISCANHVHLWDYLAIMYAIKPHKPYILSWAKNISGENGTLIRLNGGIPIPEGNVAASMKYIKDVKALIESGNWLHIYAEGSMWEFYKPIRPFKSGLGFFSRATGRPILPMAFSYRKPNFIRRKIFGQIACFNLAIGDPIYPDENKKPKECEEDIIRRCHESVCTLAGISPKENIYPPIFDGNKRID